MTQDEIIKLAREAGGCEYGNANPDIESTFILKDDQIKAFANLVAEHEREACAKVCEAGVNADKYLSLTDCAAAIRARGNT